MNGFRDLFQGGGYFKKLMNLELRHLDLVRTVVEEGGLTRAGKLLGLSQSALSHQLRDVEEQFAVPLFHRIGRRLVLAPAGERILRAARIVIPEIERTELDLRDNSSQSPGRIRLSAECYICYSWLPPVLSRFERKYPMVELSIVTEATRTPIQALLKDELDIAVVSQPVRDRRMKIFHLLDDELLAVTAAGHSLADRRYLRPKDFSSETVFSYSPISTSPWYLRVLRPAGIRPKNVSEIPLTEGIIELVKAGFGIAVLAQRIIQPYLASGELRAIPITGRGLRRRWYAAARNVKNPPAYLTAFLQTLRGN